MSSTLRKLSAHEVRQVSVAAQVDPRTVRLFLAGAAGAGPRTLARQRIEKALTELGLGEPNGVAGPAGGAGSGAAAGRRGPRRAPRGADR